MDKDRAHMDVWVQMYQEQIRHVRHHESLRSNATNISVVVSAAILGLFAADVISNRQWLLSLFLIVVNLYGVTMSLKHYERSKLHHAVSERYRHVISRASAFDESAINELRRQARSEHRARHYLIGRVRANWMWCGLHVLLALLGAGLLLSQPQEVAAWRELSCAWR